MHCGPLCREGFLPQEVYDAQTEIIVQTRLISGIQPSEHPDNCQDFKNEMTYEMCYGDNPPVSALGECGAYYYEQYSKAPEDARDHFSGLFIERGLGFVPDRFFSGEGGTLDFTPYSPLMQSLEESASFQEIHSELTRNIQEYIFSNENDKINNEIFLEMRDKGLPDFSEWNGKKYTPSPTLLYVTMGGTKYMEVDVKITKTGNRHSMQLTYHIYDTFGADKSDILCDDGLYDLAWKWPPYYLYPKVAVKELKAFFLLQHYTTIGGGLCRPFITKIVTTKTIEF